MQFRNNSTKAIIPEEFKLCQPEETAIVQVHGERVLKENRLDIKRQSDQKEQQVNGVKRAIKSRKKVRKDAKRRLRKDAKIGRIRREEREREQ